MKPDRIDWHRIVFWASAGVAVVLLLYRSLSKDGRLITIFTSEGRDLFGRILRIFTGY